MAFPEPRGSDLGKMPWKDFGSMLISMCTSNGPRIHWRNVGIIFFLRIFLRSTVLWVPQSKNYIFVGQNINLNLSDYHLSSLLFCCVNSHNDRRDYKHSLNLVYLINVRRVNKWFWTNTHTITYYHLWPVTKTII